MLCERCKSREATIVIREMINGISTEKHLCSQCAAQTDLGILLDEENSFSRLLSGILGLKNEKESEKDESSAALSCPVCKTSYRDFVKKGRFGCSECCETFGLLIRDNIKKLQGSDTHTGKHPKYMGEGCEHSTRVDQIRKEESWEEKLEILAAKQQEAILEEDYEEAARIRDEIRSLKERTGES